MNKTLIFGLLATAIAGRADANTISRWTFETAPITSLVDSTSISGINADLGNGVASGRHASAATDWTTAEGRSSLTSLMSDNWSVGDYWQFSLNTVGFQNLSVSWDQVSSAKGPGHFSLFWSTSGLDGSFTEAFDTYSVPQAAGGTWGSYAFNLTSIDSLNNNANVYFRLLDMSTLNAAGTGNVVAKGIHRVDNFTVQGDLISAGNTDPVRVPDKLPFTFTACFLSGFLVVAHRLYGKTNRERSRLAC